MWKCLNLAPAPAARCTSCTLRSAAATNWPRLIARKDTRATIEACIHYLTLDEENDVRRLGGKAKINPPLRSRNEVEAIWHHLAAGNVTIVSTDHVSWSEDRKTDPNMLKNASGVPGLEVLYALLMKGLERAQIAADPCRAAVGAQSRRAVSHRACQGRARGRPRRRHRADAARSVSLQAPPTAATIMSRGVPTTGSSCRSALSRHLCAGNCVMADGRVTGEPGTGRFVSTIVHGALSGDCKCPPTLPLDADRLWADMMALAEITEPDRPYTRRSFSPLFLKGRAWLAERFRRSGAWRPASIPPAI